MVANILHHARTVGVMADDPTVLFLLQNVHSAHELCAVRKAVEQRNNRLLARHGHVAPVPAIHALHGGNDAGQVVLLHIEHDVNRIYAQLFKGKVVGSWRHRMANRAAQQAN